MIIVLFVSTNVLIWTISQNNLYSQSVRESHQVDEDRFSERVIAYDGNYSVPILGGDVQVKGTLANEGPVSAQILTLWVLDETNKEYNVTDLREGNYNLNPGDTRPVTIEVTIPGASSDHTFNSWFITARGNLVPLEKEKEVITVAHVAQGIGALGLDFDTFRYFTYESPQNLTNYPNGTLGFNVPKGEYVAFGCWLTNFDYPQKRNITIDSHSLFWQPGRSGVSEGDWFIVNVNSDGTINGTYSQIALVWGKPKMLVFASAKDLGIGSFLRQSTPNTVTTVATFLLLHGTLHGPTGSIPFGQSIPFVSLFYS